MTSSFYAPRSFDPSYSLLGRALRTWTGDRLQGEALHIIVCTGLGLALLMSHYLSWTLLRPLFTAHPSWQTMFWGGQALSVCVWAGIGLIGFRPGVTVSCIDSALTLKQGTRSQIVPYNDIEHVEPVSATTFHRHYRRYAATTIFVSRLPDEVLLLRTPDGPIVVALPNTDDREALRRHLTDAECEVPDPVPQA